MFETLQNLAHGFAVALSPSILAYAFAGCVIGWCRSATMLARSSECAS